MHPSSLVPHVHKQLRRLLAACPLARRVLEGMADGRDSSRHRGSGNGYGWPLPDLELLITVGGVWLVGFGRMVVVAFVLTSDVHAYMHAIET